MKLPSPRYVFCLGCCVAALAVQTVGNRPVLMEDVGKFVDQVSAITDAI